MLLHCEVQGTGEPLLMLHGLFGSNSNLGAVSRLLEPHFQIYRVDLRNHGQSPHASSMTFKDMADDVGELMDAHNVQQAHLLGHSLGGKVGMEFALRHAERIDKLIVADIAPITYPPHHTEILQALQAVNVNAINSRSDADKELAKLIADPGVRQFLLKNLVRHDDGGFRWLLNLPAIVASYDNLRASVSEGLVYEGETLFIRGANSDYIRDQDIPAVRQQFPNAKIATIDGAGHWLHAEQPKVFAQMVLEFLLIK